MKGIVVLALVVFAFSGCSASNSATQSLARAIYVETLNTKDNQDCVLVKLEVEGSATMFAYKIDANMPPKINVENIVNFYSDALLYPEETKNIL